MLVLNENHWDQANKSPTKLLCKNGGRRNHPSPMEAIIRNRALILFESFTCSPLTQSRKPKTSPVAFVKRRPTPKIFASGRPALATFCNFATHVTLLNCDFSTLN